MKKLLEKIRKIDDKYKIIFFRWWFSAAVCFFIAWGLQLGNQRSTFDLIFFLGLAMGIGNIFIFNPIITSVFEIKKRGKIANKKMNERTILEGICYFIGEILKASVGVYLVSWIYEGINRLINYIGNYPDTHMAFGIEPITFGIIFTVVYQVIDFLLGILVELVLKIFKRGGAKDEADLARREEKGEQGS